MRKGNRWELMLRFSTKYPPKLIWLILCVDMSRTLTCDAMGNMKTNYDSIASLSTEL